MEAGVLIQAASGSIRATFILSFKATLHHHRCAHTGENIVGWGLGTPGGSRHHWGGVPADKWGLHILDISYK